MDLIAEVAEAYAGERVKYRSANTDVSTCESARRGRDSGESEQPRQKNFAHFDSPNRCGIIPALCRAEIDQIGKPLAVTLITGLAESPLQLIVQSSPNTLLGTYPTVMIAALCGADLAPRRASKNCMRIILGASVAADMNIKNEDSLGEFESTALKVEKVIGGGQQGTAYLRPLDPRPLSVYGRVSSRDCTGRGDRPMSTAQRLLGAAASCEASWSLIKPD
jgi:hypothetical protein